MTLDRLQHFNGSPVRITLDGAPALAILFFLTVDSVQITSLCFLETPGRCPLVRHSLTPAEIESITPMSRNELRSEIALRSAAEAKARAERDKRFQEDLAHLQHRMQAARKKSSREITRASELRRQARDTVQTCANAQRSIKDCHEVIRKSRNTRATKSR